MRHSPSGLPSIETRPARRLPVPDPAVVFCEVEEGAVLLSTSEEAYYGLNEVGARVWSLLPSHETVASLSSELSLSYPDVDIVQLEADVTALLDDLVASHLVAYP